MQGSQFDAGLLFHVRYAAHGPDGRAGADSHREDQEGICPALAVKKQPPQNGGCAEVAAYKVLIGRLLTQLDKFPSRSADRSLPCRRMHLPLQQRVVMYPRQVARSLPPVTGLIRAWRDHRAK